MRWLQGLDPHEMRSQIGKGGNARSPTAQNNKIQVYVPSSSLLLYLEERLLSLLSLIRRTKETNTSAAAKETENQTQQRERETETEKGQTDRQTGGL